MTILFKIAITLGIVAAVLGLIGIFTGNENKFLVTGFLISFTASLLLIILAGLQ